MIIFFIYYKSLKLWIDTLFFLKRQYPRSIVLTRFSRHYFEKADVIIPITVRCQKKLNRFHEYKHKFLTTDNRIYDILDDKIKFYNFVRENDLLHNSNIKLIRSYGIDYSGSNFYGKFIIKHKNGSGSSKNKIVEGYIKNLIRKHSDDYQIQKLLDVDHINCISCCCKNGEIIECLNFVTPHFISKKLYKTNHTLTLKRPKKKYIDIISKIVKTINYSGLIEFEFLVDKHKKSYLIECNPRISGTIRCILYQHNDVPYINLINSYINSLCKTKLPIYHYDHEKLNYDGRFEKVNYSVSSEGKVHFQKQYLF